jgi:superfamily II DNA or RNA helicase
MNIMTPTSSVSPGALMVAAGYKFPPSAFTVQKLTAALFMENRRGYCLNELGTGKTRSVLFAYDALKKARIVQRMLVICPLTAMKRTWWREVKREFPWLTVAILHGTKKQREQKLMHKADVYIINHDGLGVLFDQLSSRHDIDCVCVDEIAVYRNGRAERTKTLREFVVNKNYVWGLTGSPIPRAVTDVWGPCSCITPWTVPKWFLIFRDQLMIKRTMFTWEPKPQAEEHAVACMQPSVRFRLDEVTELPERVINYYEAPLSPKQSYVYEAMRKGALAIVGSEKIDALNAGAILSKLLQIAIGYVYNRAGKTIHLENTQRLQLILDLIDSTSEKVLLFAPYKSAVKALSVMLADNKIDHAVVTGDTLLKERDQIFAEFQDTRKYKTILAHPGCMSHSLTLTRANTTIWAGPVTSLETFTQANARTFRVGQQHKTLIAMVGGTPAERKIYQLLGRNEKLQNRFLEIMEAITEDNSSE